MEDFHGITVGNDFIILKTKRKENEPHNNNVWYESISVYHAEESSFTTLRKNGMSQSKLLKAYREAKGSCFVTLNSKHFLQIGGSNEGLPVTTVKLFSYENRKIFVLGEQRGRTPQVRLIIEPISIFNFRTQNIQYLIYCILTFA